MSAGTQNSPQETRSITNTCMPAAHPNPTSTNTHSRIQREGEKIRRMITMCNSLEEFDCCQKCGKTWNIDTTHTILCYHQHCRLEEPLIHHNLCTFCKRMDTPAESKRRHGGFSPKSEPLLVVVWESESNIFSCVWTAPRYETVEETGTHEG